jgi:hypothetical protein
MKFRVLFLPVLLITFTVCGTVAVLGQGTDLGTIRGTVTDASGAVVPNASVTITDQTTNSTRRTSTNSHGEYQVFGLVSGTYKVSISTAGMSTQDITGVRLNGSDVFNADAVLRISKTSESVVVSAEAPTINTADQTIADTITNREVIDLPRDSRDVYSFLYLNPNITQSTGDGTFKFLGFQSYGANFTLDGQRSTSTLDGSATDSQGHSRLWANSTFCRMISAQSTPEFPVFA